MSLEDRINTDLIKALKAGDKDRVTVLRGLKSDLKYAKIDKKGDLTEADEIAAMSSAAKKRRESIEQYQNANRPDLAEKEKRELEVIQDYLPKQLSEDEVRQLVKAAIDETGAESPQQIGLVMKAVMPKLKGQADGKMVNKLAMEILAK